MKLKHIFLTMILVLVAVSASVSTADARAGEDPWDMMDRIIYHSGSWMLSTGHLCPQAKMRELIRIDEITNCSPESEYCEGICTVVPGKNGETTGEFIMMDGRMFYVQEPGTNQTVFAMKKL